MKKAQRNSATRQMRRVSLFQKAAEWRRQLDAGEVANQAEIARREGITRARVTQIMDLMRLAPEIRERLTTGASALENRGTEHRIRLITRLRNTAEQVDAFKHILPGIGP